MSKMNVLHSLGFLLILAGLLSACSPEEYGPCSIPSTSAHKAACAPQGENQVATCTADYVFDCDSLICGIYSNSSAFCTHRCVPTKEECLKSGIDPSKCTEEHYLKCPAGASCKSPCPEDARCVEWVKGTAAFYCLPAEYGGSAATSGGGNPSTGAGSNTDGGADDSGSESGNE